MRLRDLPLALTLALPLGCVAPWPALETCPDEGCAQGTDTDDGPLDTAGITVTATSATGGASSSGDDSTSTSGEPEAPGSTGSPPAGPPTIAAVDVGPSPIHHNGSITVEVEADNADGVRMSLESGDVIELSVGGEGLFVGELAALTGLENGEHALTLTPWRADEEGEPAEAAYVIALPKPGSEGFWETGDTIGAGFVAALGILPEGDLLELGTHYVDDAPRCYVRRRDKSGAWWDADVIDILGDQPCTAIDLQITEDGTTYLLLLRHDNGIARWWLGELAAWGDPTKNLLLGNPGEEAVALAIGAEEVAVCGSVPTVFDDGKDAAAWIHRPGQLGKPWIFDYWPDQGAHRFGETVRDCAFAGDELVMVGEMRGKHEEEKQAKRDRHFITRFDPHTEEKGWLVASSGLGLQSGATAVAIDDEGRVLTAGYRCADECAPIGMLEVHDRDGLLWHADIGAWPTKSYAARELLWSPAGYALVASGGPSGSEAAFVIRAYAPLEQVAPLWTYVRADANAVHMALTLALGPFAEIWAGGFGQSGYPAIAQLAG